jgi:hypothetical protein
MSMAKLLKRRTILLAALYNDGDVAEDLVVAFCNGNITQFSAFLSNTSGEMLRKISTRGLYGLGTRWSGIKIPVPKFATRANRENLFPELSRDDAKALIEEFSGTAIFSSNIIDEFYRFYGIGFMLWARSQGKTCRRIALALGMSERNQYHNLTRARIQRNPLVFKPFAAGFARYWAMIYPGDDISHDEPADGDLIDPATTIAEDLLNAELNAPTANAVPSNHARRDKP